MLRIPYIATSHLIAKPCRRLSIDQPCEPAIDWADDLARQARWIKWPFENVAQRVGLRSAAEEKQQLPAVAQYRRGESQTIGLKLLHPGGYDETMLLVDCLRAWKERRRVAVGAHA